MRNSRFMVRVRSCVDDHILRWVTPKEARMMCGEDNFGNALEGAEPVAVRLTRKKETLKDIRLRHPERAHDSSPCSISAKEVWLNAMVESGLALRATDTIAEMEGIAAKIQYQAVASENNRAVTIVPGKVLGLTECAI
jgi:hypothetical protein